MATAKKHMERSRRSHNSNYGVFNNFHRNAYKIAMHKSQKNESLVGMLKRALAPHRKTEGGM